MKVSCRINWSKVSIRCLGKNRNKNVKIYRSDIFYPECAMNDSKISIVRKDVYLKGLEQDMLMRHITG